MLPPVSCPRILSTMPRAISEMDPGTGNWNVSNQPNLAANAPSRGSLRSADRDWHVVMMDEGLAQVFEACSSGSSRSGSSRPPGSFAPR